jgi:hypothetical protein
MNSLNGQIGHSGHFDQKGRWKGSMRILKSFLAVAVLAWPLVGLARLGESLAEIRARYGAELGRQTNCGMDIREFAFRKFGVRVVFKNGTSAAEWIMVTNAQERLSDVTCVALAEAVSGRADWKLEPPRAGGAKMWASGPLRAVKEDGVFKEDSLVIADMGFFADFFSRIDSEDRAAADGFGGPAAPCLKPIQDFQPVAEFDAAGRSARAARATREAAAAAAEKKRAEADLLYNRWLRQQATNGSPSAQFDLAQRLRAGIGVSANPVEAQIWLKQAASNGHLHAQNLLKQ